MEITDRYQWCHLLSVIHEYGILRSDGIHDAVR